MNDITTALDQRETTQPADGPTGTGATHPDLRTRSPLVRAGAVALQDGIALCDAAGWAALGLALRGSLRQTPTGLASGHGVSSPRSR